MLKLLIPGEEFWDEKKEIFINSKESNLLLEHSLISLKRWEAKYKRPFLKEGDQKTPEELIDYIKMMTIAQPKSDLVYDIIANSPILLDQINKYLEDDMTATTFAVTDAGDQYNPKKTVITAEIIYYWMVSFNIPFECEKWHLNSLFTLIRVCAIKNQPPKKMTKREIYSRNRELNAKRKAELNTTG